MTKTAQRILAAAILPALLTTRGAAQLSISDLNQTYTIDFDTTVAGVNSGAFAGLGFIPAPGPADTGFLDSNAWAITGFSDGDLAFGGQRTTGDYARGMPAGSVTTGGIYAFSGGSIQGVALGIQPVGDDVTPGTFTLRIQNNTAEQITGFTLDYVVHVANNAPRGNTFNFSHSGDDSNYTSEASLDLASGTEIGAVTTFEANHRTISLADLTLEAGAFYYLRWTTDDFTGSGARDEFALDDIKIQGFSSASTVRNYWDPNGAAPGLGGAGEWTGAGLVFNESPDGSGPAVAADPARPIVFSGTPGEVVVGSGAAANNGIEVTVDGYRFAGGPIALGGSIPAFKVTNDADTTEVAASISGTAGLRKTGAGRLVLAADNSATLSGAITILEGTLEISEDNQLGAPANPVALASGTLKTTASLVLDAARALSGTGGLDIAPGTTLTVAGNSSFGAVTLTNAGELEFSSATPGTGALTFEQPTAISAPNGTLAVNGNITTTHTTGTVVFSANLDLGNAARVFTVADGSAVADLLLAGTITGGSSGRLNKLGAGTLEVTGDLSGLAGGVAIGNTAEPLLPGGTLAVYSDTALGGTPALAGATLFFNSGTLQNASPIPLVFNNAVSFAAGRIENGATFSGRPMTFLGSASLFSPANSFLQHKIVLDTDVTFAGGLNAADNPGSGISTGVTIAGTGTLHLPHTFNSVPLPITVDGATLNVGGSLAFTTVTVTGGGLLTGATNTGIDTGESITIVTIDAAGTINPSEGADPTGALHIFNFTLESGGAFGVDLQGTAAGEFDQLVVSNEITLAGSLQIDLAQGYAPLPGDQFIIILNEGSNAVSGTFAGMADDTPFSLFGTAFAVDYQGGDGNDVVLSVVPEPGSVMLLLAGAFAATRLRRRNLA